MSIPSKTIQPLLTSIKSLASHHIPSLRPKALIFLAIQPVEGVGRDIRDALLGFTDSKQAAAFVFSSSPASKLSREWSIIVVSGDTAHSFAINGGAVLIPPRPQSWRALKRGDLGWRYPCIGYTVDSIEEITKKAVEISWPMKYSVYSENCQSFTYLLFEAIRLPQQPPTVADVFAGLDKIPRPFRTLFHRCVTVFGSILVSLLNRAISVLQRTRTAVRSIVLALLQPFVWYGVWVKDTSILCLNVALFSAKVYLHLLFAVLGFVYNRNLQDGFQELKNIADEVRRFDGYKRPAKDSGKVL